MQSHQNKCEPTNEFDNCFKLLTEQEMVLLNSNRTDIRFNKGETVVKQGTRSTDLMYIKSGIVKVTMNNGDNTLILSIRTDSHFIGLENIYGHDFHVHTVTALNDTLISFIDISAVRQLIKLNSAFNAEIYKIITKGMITTYDRFFSLTQKQLHGRFADILLCLSNRIFQAKSFDLPLSRKDLAALTGMAPESVIRIIKDFKNDKMIATKGKRIEILDEPLLKKISDVG